MFQFFKKIFNKPADDDSNVMDQQPGPQSSTNKAAPQMPAQSAAPRPAPHSRTPAARPDSNGNSVQVPLQAILNGLPLELKSRVRQTDVGDAMLSLSVEKVLAQLSLGSVKIAFGDLRRAAPQVFSSSADCDQVQVTLPLQEILARINPAMLVRRQDQKQVDVPEDVSSPFGDRGQGLVFSGGTNKGSTPAAPRSITPAAPAAPQPTIQPKPIQPVPIQPKPVQPKPVQAAPVPPKPVQPKPIQPKPVQAAPVQPAPVQSAPVQPKPIQPKPIQPIPFQPKPVQSAPIKPAPIQPAPIQPAPIQPLSMRSPISPVSHATPAPVPPPSASPSTPASAIPASAALRGLGAALTPQSPRTPAASREIQPRAAVANPAEPSGSGANVIVPIAALAESWPEAVRLEIVQSKAAEAHVSLPADAIEDALKRGRVAFQWKMLRSWIVPPTAQGSSAHDNAVLELPLKVITPLFLARKKEGLKPHQKVAVDDSIPNLFFGFPQPDAPEAGNVATGTPGGSGASHAVTKPVDTNYYVWDDASESAQVDEGDNKRKTPGTEFVTRYATPNEVVSRAAAMDGVAGALIALPDGLMVASRLAQDLNGDTLAAFLPHIFGKVSQCTKELRMGELNNLNFTVGNVPWKIFRVNAIFFAAFGRVGQPLPTAQLAALAAELDHKKA